MHQQLLAVFLFWDATFWWPLIPRLYICLIFQTFSVIHWCHKFYHHKFCLVLFAWIVLPVLRKVLNNEHLSDFYEFKGCAHCFLCFNKRKHFKNYEKCFLFHQKSTFWDIHFSVIFSSSFPHFPDSKGQMKLEWL